MEADEITVTLPLTLGSMMKLFPVIVETWVTNSRMSAFFRFILQVPVSALTPNEKNIRRLIKNLFFFRLYIFSSLTVL